MFGDDIKIEFSDDDNIITGNTQSPTEPSAPEPTPIKPAQQPDIKTVAETQKKELNTQVANKAPLNNIVERQETPPEQTPTETQEESAEPEAEEGFEEGFKEESDEPEAEERKTTYPPAVSDDKKYIEMFTDGVFSIMDQSKPLIESITKIGKSLKNIKDENKYYAIVEIAAEQLSTATDKEGNKLFKDKEEAKRLLLNLKSMNSHRIKYKLPIAIRKEIKEKEPKTVNPLLKRQTIRHSINQNMYQY